MKDQPFVLIIEDSIELANIFVEILEMSGMKVELITDGAIAMQKLAVEIPDLMLLDMHLPNVSGLEILDYVRATDRLRNTRVVAITANALLTVDLMDKADLLLIKPVTFAQISELSTRLLNIVKPTSLDKT
jgi:CheY-like chemotaxis protein